MRKISLLFIGNFLQPKYGSASVANELANKLASKGHIIYSASAISNRYFRLVDMIFKTLISIKKIDIAVVDVFSGNAFFWANIVGNLLFFFKKPFILVLRGGNLPLYSAHHFKKVEALLRKSQYIVAPSSYLYTKFSSYHKNIQIIANPINLERYKKHVIDSPRPQLLWLRAFHKIYNPYLAVQVIYQLREEFPNIQLEMVGPNKKDNTLYEINELIAKLKLEDFINIIGPIKKTEVPIITATNHIFLNTTNIDNTPVSVIEAMACGLCVVSTNVGGIPYLLDDDEDALLVPPDNPQAMASAVRRILTEPGLAIRLSQNARQKAEQLDWSMILPQWEALFSEVINRYESTQAENFGDEND